jgi:hypothetical protein
LAGVASPNVGGRSQQNQALGEIKFDEMRTAFLKYMFSANQGCTVQFSLKHDHSRLDLGTLHASLRKIEIQSAQFLWRSHATQMGVFENVGENHQT